MCIYIYRVPLHNIIISVYICECIDPHMAHTNKTRLGTNRVYVYLIPNNFTYHTSEKTILCVTEGQVCNPLRKPLRKPSRRASKLKHIRAMVKTWSSIPEWESFRYSMV